MFTVGVTSKLNCSNYYLKRGYSKYFTVQIMQRIMNKFLVRANMNISQKPQNMKHNMLRH